MSAFEMVHQDRVVGKLVGFDRLIFKGHLTRFYPAGAMKAFLDRQGVLLKDFAGYVSKVTGEIKAHAQQTAAEAGRRYVYLAETHTRCAGQSKEELARQIMAADKVTAGLICVLAAVEPCRSFDIYRNKETKRLEVVLTDTLDEDGRGGRRHWRAGWMRGWLSLPCRWYDDTAGTTV